MCGIAGLFDLAGLRPVDPARLGRMNAALVHRGPDGEGTHLAPGIGLGHRRLAIIDLHTGQQPMADAQQRLQIVYNGEIYNYRALRRELEAKGHPFLTQSDTEAILQGYHAWGADGLTRLNGMFAIALWDQAADTLLLARDRMGEKPLYYSVTADGWLLFASEITAVLVGLEAEPPLRPDAVADYFAYGYVPDPKTIYQGVFKLEPGQKLELCRGMDAAAVVPEPYWRLSAAAGPALSAEEAQEELAERLAAVVRERMVSDVPLGAFLSGGVDSSGIVALMAGASETPVRTCAMGFPDPKYDETAYAQMVAERYGTDHYREVVELEAVDLVGRLALAYGEPFADPSALPTFRVSKLARSRVTVALSGDGGDEAFAGYRRYPFHMREEAVKARLPAGLRRLVFGPL
ncbi:MAG: asparagine synthase (glutamine-hydrolyzing), partial [Alphaproteobacteria bacterium]|nr:asparagine synthase (glutamine-hydrolyzing) [Alphaproteobacteria bacterium]